MERPEGVSLFKVLSLPCIIGFKIFHPTTQTDFRAFYSPKESSLKERPEGSLWFECSLYHILSPKGEFSLRGVPLVEWLSLPYIIPQRRVPLRNDPRGPFGLSALFALCYWEKKILPPTTQSKYPLLFPKGEFP